jgi:predicted DNA-binding ribbon-helix-helix protein
LSGLSRPSLYRPAVKRSVTIAGHPTSIRLEPAFWDLLNAESLRLGLPLNALVARIDAERAAVEPSPNLASALRLWVLAQAMAGATTALPPLSD